MPINVFGSTSGNTEYKNDTSLFVRKHFWRTNFLESISEEDSDMKNQYRIKIVRDSKTIRESVSETYVDNKYNDSSIIKNTAHVDFNEKSLRNVRFIKVNSKPAVNEHLETNYYVDQAISDSVDEPSLSPLDLDKKLKLDEQVSKIPIST